MHTSSYVAWRCSALTRELISIIPYTCSVPILHCVLLVRTAPTARTTWGVVRVRLVTPAATRFLALNLAQPARPLPAAFAQRDRRQPQAHYVPPDITVKAAPVTSRVAQPPLAAIAQRDHRQPQARYVRWGIFAWAALVTSKVVWPPLAAIAQRDRRQPQAHCVRWGIIAWAAPVTNRVAQPPPAAIAQRGRR